MYYWLITGVLKNKELKNKLLKVFKLKGYGFRTTWRPLHSLKIFNNCPRDNMEISNDLLEEQLTFQVVRNLIKMKKIFLFQLTFRLLH